MAEDVRVRIDYPFDVEVVENEWIPLSCGLRLAAKLWLPAGAGPVPAVLCYLPYRKADGVSVGDDQEMRYTAGHGYAGVRIDIRGTGDSDGIILDEYTEEEQLDCVEAIAWIAAQPWCDGNVGMTGYSWGGFNALQVAARRPPALKAIMSFYASDDRYADDVHYRGGCVLAMDMLHWAVCMLGFNAMPPDPRFAGESWRERWLERLELTPPFIEAWLSHQRRDSYWKHGSVCEDYAAIQCPVYAVGGWTDGYTDAVFRLLERLSVPRKGLVGPWGHNDPVRGIPGPPVGILQEQVRWWDRWLKGIDNGIVDEPMLTFWLQDWVEPRARLEHRPGRWAAEEAWPSPRVEVLELALGEGTLGAERAGQAPPLQATQAGDALPLRITGLQTCGLDSGAWCADGHSDDLPPDQRAEDGRSLCFDSQPLGAALEILGKPEVVLEMAADRPLALVCVRLCDVAPGGASLLVTRGLLNLTHRDGHEHPQPIEPGRRYTVRVRLDAIAHRFRAGHRLRIAVSPTYWPWAWPSPELVTLSLFPYGEARLVLPVRPARAEDAAIDFPEPEEPPPYPSTVLRQDTGQRVVSHDLATGRSELRFDWDMGGRVLLEETGTELDYSSTATYSIVEGDPLSARADVDNGVGLRRGDEWDTHCRATGTMTSTATHFHVSAGLEAFERGRRVFVRTWSFELPRDHV
jgi:putative CocE/NonD family hydrolase